MPYAANAGETSCEACRRRFTQRRATGRYCSAACRVWAHRHKQPIRSAERERIAAGPRPCLNPECVHWIGALDRPDKKFCSNACRQRVWREDRPLPDLTGFAEAFADVLP
jgi:hypothetical protein